LGQFDKKQPPNISSLRQQSSFGRNRAKQCWPVWRQGIANFAEAMASANEVGQNFAAQVLRDLQGKGRYGKEAFLLT
jgi:hypothetical protein